ncbi:MAG: Crp/Fnr family transcriptional regulator [Chthoniobacter sp.]|nr:Crp/Fnr family transcriptional regulator [Chthoniobacter sp.]
MSSRFDDLKAAARNSALRACSLFAGLPPADLDRIAAFAQFLPVAKGGYLFHEGEPSNGFYVVRTGAINVHRVTPDGREQVIHVFRPGDSLAEATLAGDAGYPADARAVEKSEVIFIPRRDFLELIKTRTDLALRMLASMSQHLRVLVNALDDLTRKDVETRLAHWLLKRCPQRLSHAAFELRLDVTKTVLAAELRTRHETLSRALARLREMGLIKSAGKTIRILDPLGLDAVLRTNLGETRESRPHQG